MSPGLVFSLFGDGLGPSTLTSGAFNASGVLPNEIAGTQVLFDGIPAPLLWVRNDQLAGIVPHGAGATSPNCSVLQVKQGTNLSARVAKVAFSESPNLFTASSTGVGQAAAANEDGPFNNSSNPIARGHVIVLYATGAGRTAPDSTDGKQTVPPTLPKPTSDVSVMIGGQVAQINYAAAAPFLVAGVMQINAVVPMGIAPGSAVPVALNVNGNPSSGYIDGAVTIAMK